MWQRSDCLGLFSRCSWPWFWVVGARPGPSGVAVPASPVRPEASFSVMHRAVTAELASEVWKQVFSVHVYPTGASRCPGQTVHTFRPGSSTLRYSRHELTILRQHCCYCKANLGRCVQDLPQKYRPQKASIGLNQLGGSVCKLRQQASSVASSSVRAPVNRAGVLARLSEHSGARRTAQVRLLKNSAVSAAAPSTSSQGGYIITRPVVAGKGLRPRKQRRTSGAIIGLWNHRRGLDTTPGTPTTPPSSIARP